MDALATNFKLIMSKVPTMNRAQLILHLILHLVLIYIDTFNYIQRFGKDFDSGML